MQGSDKTEDNNPTKTELSELLFGFLETIYRFQRREEGLFDISWDDIYLLQRLKRDGPSPISLLAAYLDVPVFETSRQLSRLENKGLVTKTRSEENRRVVLAELSERGLKLLLQVEDYHYHVLSKNLSILQKAEQEGLKSAVAKLSRLLELEKN